MINLSQFIIGLILKQIKQFVSVLCKKKIGSKMLILFLKFGSYINRSLILSSIGNFFFKLFLIEKTSGYRLKVYIIFNAQNVNSQKFSFFFF